MSDRAAASTASAGTAWPLWPAALLLPALALAALAWGPLFGLPLLHPTYLREALLVVLAAPALAVGLAALGPTRAALAAALGPAPARLFLLAVWGQATLAWASLGWTSSLEATVPRAVELTALALWGTGWLLAGSAHPRLRGWLLAGHFAVGALIAVIGSAAYAWWRLHGVPPARLGAPISNPNTVAVLMFFPVAGVLAWFLVPSSWFLVGGPRNGNEAAATLCEPGTRNQEPGTIRRAAVLVVGILAMATFLLARSRSGYAGLSAAGVFLLGIHLRPRWRLCGMGALALAAVGAALFVAADPARMARLEEWLKLGSLGSRYFGSLAGWGIFSEHPLLGAGAGTFLAEAPAHIPPEHYLGSYADAFLNLAHNEYAQSAAEGGLLGLGLLLALFAAVIWGGLRGTGAGWRVEQGFRKAGVGHTFEEKNRPFDSSLQNTTPECSATTQSRGKSKRPDFPHDCVPNPHFAEIRTEDGGRRPGADEDGPASSSSTLHPPASTLHPLSLALATATVGVMVSSLADPSLRFWDFTIFFYAGAGLVVARPCRRRAAAVGGEAPSGLRRSGGPIPKAAVLGAGLLAAVVAAWLWAAPDLVRERALLLAHSLSYGKGDQAAAIGEYRVATSTRGNYLARVLAEYEMIRALGLAGRKGEALLQAEDFARRIPACPQILRQLATARYVNGNRAGALAALVEAGRRDPFDRGFRGRFLRVLAAEPKPGREALVEKAAAELKLPPGDLATLGSLAAAAGGDWAGALAAVEGLAPADASFLPLWLWRGICLAEAGRPGEALEAFDRHLAVERLHSEGWYWRARAIQAAAQARGDARVPGEAIASLRRCIDLNLEDDDARIELSGLLLRTDRPREVLDLLEPRLPVASRATEFALVMAEAYCRLDRRDEARSVLESTLRRTNDQRLRKALDRLAQLENQPQMNTDGHR